MGMDNNGYAIVSTKDASGQRASSVDNFRISCYLSI